MFLLKYKSVNYIGISQVYSSKFKNKSICHMFFTLKLGPLKRIKSLFRKYSRMIKKYYILKKS